MYRVITNSKSSNIIIAKASIIAEAGTYDLKFYTKQLGSITVVYAINNS